MVVRISKGRFDTARMGEAERALRASEAALRNGLSSLPGLVHYYVGIDRDKGFLTNVSVWESLAAAKQMDNFAPMLEQRPILEAAGVEFEVITNHDVLWSITP